MHATWPMRASRATPSAAPGRLFRSSLVYRTDQCEPARTSGAHARCG
ncbi:hypothetical protein BMA10247_3087 [Burkholderia mallei NCTC 10247]|uniref:Uncharacterized protein n=1 Tax=Burkholderia mallei (strain NCTC 10229) TaxID=412022 RepID=A2S6R7_BURM9|nr:hypothetical protein BMA10229_A1656 [Burkholderia mallei NCTC 10229]ABO06311.1 hypothetical protein BMA10247_3087 [Burkholderia mallei NCTC 10247]